MSNLETNGIWLRIMTNKATIITIIIIILVTIITDTQIIIAE